MTEYPLRKRLKTIIFPVIFNIILPTVDVITDARLIILLFVGAYTCIHASNDHPEDNTSSEDDPNTNCTIITAARNFSEDYLQCCHDPAVYCSSKTTNHDVCGGYVTHPR